MIHVHKKSAAFEAEFLTLHGERVDVATLDASQVWPIQKKEIVHARPLKAS